ncbi:helix-turn-helix domain-containing protein [Halorarum halobium]|uniref:helix-turn-helix domain-containing protein n=1 Tax=Halorarum halobium TaxID=3075121 RepID=UPI0028A60151|nr:helix-turn-helix domain-containing protein [Halobaculum sp. XH14]
MKLDGTDQALLSALGDDQHTVEALAADLDRPSDELRSRLRALADNGLVTESTGGDVRRTDSGRRVAARRAGATDSRIDTTPAVERVLATFRLRPDEADAVRDSFAFLRYWGRATPDELIDAIHREEPAGYATGDTWWTDCVRDPLAALPRVVAPTRPTDSWRYAGPPESATSGADGTRRLGRGGHRPFGSVKQAIESLALAPAEREAVRAAFGVVRRRGEASERDVAAATFPDHPAGYPTPDAWTAGLVRPAFARLPGVSRVRGDGWRYRRRSPPRPRRRRPDGPRAL